MRQKAFTIIEVMIVVLIIGILMGIAVPQWMRSRETARETSCLANLTQVDGAKEQYAMEHRKGQGDEVTENDLWPSYLKWNHFPTCPGGGIIAVQPVGIAPSCTIHGSP